MFRGNLIKKLSQAFCPQKAFFCPAHLTDSARSLSLTMVKRIPFEALVWFTGLLILAFAGTDNHFTICPIKNVGVDFCPGCGLGRSVSLILRGQVTASFHAHPLGIFALFILSFRIINLLKQYIQNYGKSY
jgi:hypothetical protein